MGVVPDAEVLVVSPYDEPDSYSVSNAIMAWPNYWSLVMSFSLNNRQQDPMLIVQLVHPSCI